ncbi:MAG: sulfatase-like hydrolase/transferase, partial [Nitrospinota bacterium]|nr:sulfatase-like hydrolase/transferase [Nitrospinota bacterium]
VDPDYGYSQGFNSGYTTTSAKDESQIHESYVIFKEWIKMHKEDRFFLFFHTFEVHDYITAKEKHILKNIDPNNIRLQMLELYDNKIAHMDNYIGLITNDLKKLGIYDKTLIIITSDHGEEFFEHGNLGHQTSLYNELLKVPLIFRLPGKIPSKIKIKNNVRVVDIKTTILSILGIEDENPQEGKSLLSFLDNTEDENRTIFAEETGSVIGEALDIKSIQNDQYKFILSPVATTPPGFNYDIKNFGELYDLNKDLAEKRNLNEKGNLIAKKLKEEIIEITQKNIQLKEILKQNSDKSIEISEETKQRLRALGYIQ